MDWLQQISGITRDCTQDNADRKTIVFFLLATRLQVTARQTLQWVDWHMLKHYILQMQ